MGKLSEKSAASSQLSSPLIEETSTWLLKKGPWQVRINKESPLPFEVCLTTFGMVAAYCDEQDARDHVEDQVLHRVGEWTVRFAQNASLPFEVHNDRLGRMAAYDWPGRAEQYIESKMDAQVAVHGSHRRRQAAVSA